MVPEENEDLGLSLVFYNLHGNCVIGPGRQVFRFMRHSVVVVDKISVNVCCSYLSQRRKKKIARSKDANQ